MKKIVVAAGFLLCCLLLAGCGKTEATKAVQTMIDEMGSVSIDNEEKIKEVRAAFDALSDEEKAKVKNCAKLENAEKDLNNIKDINKNIAVMLKAADGSFPKIEAKPAAEPEEGTESESGSEAESKEEVELSELIKQAEEIEQLYSGMPENYKAQIKDYEKLADAKQTLSQYIENAQRAAVQYIKAFNNIYKDKNYTVKQVYCIKQLKDTRDEKGKMDEYHLFAITYQFDGDKETTLYAKARCGSDVTAIAIEGAADTFFSEEPGSKNYDAKEHGNITIDMDAVNALLGQ